ncbi:NADH pyrophosphatase [Tulasnella sp. JGI-2019a]|nr:NADH pyrophosphatase [Tulasnella sp. JGI-2019a]KAG8999594.1 NADH pyrophosphatase [Tulasnella sp. JGI-2019a]KAG9028930.1 NADH pyrophosphatase [Tulasnella sp. JGI-2019a]
MANTPVNFYEGTPLNRLSWLRESSAFLNAAAETPRSKWLLFKNGEPLVVKTPSNALHSLAYLSFGQIRELLGDDAKLFGQGQSKEAGPASTPIGADVNTLPQEKALQGARLRGPVIIFLGVEEDEGVKALPTSAFKSADDLTGTPYFGLDVSKVEVSRVDEALKVAAATTSEFVFMEPRSASNAFTHFDAPIFSMARSMIDWNGRNRFCPGCGSRVYSLWGGWKLSCSTLLPWANNEGQEPCITAKGLHNFAHPRTDAVVIVAILDDKADRILLGRNKKFPSGFYSTLAGFVEPSESFEDSVKREIYEESGVQVHSVRYHSCQPWPYPANLMIGFFALADAQQTIRTDLDTELEDARWFTREEILEVLNHPDGTKMTTRELKNLDQEHSTSGGLASGEKAPPSFRVPNRKQAIAGVLISEWACGKIGNTDVRSGDIGKSKI